MIDDEHSSFRPFFYSSFKWMNVIDSTAICTVRWACRVLRGDTRCDAFYSTFIVNKWVFHWVVDKVQVRTILCNKYFDVDVDVVVVLIY